MDPKPSVAMLQGFELRLDHRDGGVEIHLPVEAGLAGDKVSRELHHVGERFCLPLLLNGGGDRRSLGTLLADFGLDREGALSVISEFI